MFRVFFVKQIIFVIIILVFFAFVISEVSESFGIELQKSKLKLHKFTSHRFDGGQPIIFSGNLFSESGNRISNAEIIIKNDVNCPDDGIIAKGFTDKNGRYWIKTIAMVWNTKTNLVKIHAEFPGNENFLPSISEQQIVVVSPRQEVICE